MWKFDSMLCAALLSAPSITRYVDACTSGDEICVLSHSSLCGVDGITTSLIDGSALTYPGGETRCAFDDSSVPTAASFTTDLTYFFQVYPIENAFCIVEPICNMYKFGREVVASFVYVSRSPEKLLE
ncbi:hypothetical protein FI667_g8379, partial [Globisporangium splendens]